VAEEENCEDGKPERPPKPPAEDHERNGHGKAPV
jgi:hypothetical protein